MAEQEQRSVPADVAAAKRDAQAMFDKAEADMKAAREILKAADRVEQAYLQGELSRPSGA